MANLYNYQVSTGVITTDTGEVLDEVKQEYKDTFGEDLNTDPDTPQGALIVSETLARVAVINNNSTLANQINPNIAGGVFLDATMALTGSKRTANTHSVVPGVNLTGVAGTLIPQGSQARETVNGALFQTLTAVTLASNGTASVDFESVDTGSVPAAIGTLTQIVSGVLGWETVTNPAVAILGRAAQSDAAARLFRKNTLASQGTALALAIESALYNTENVVSLKFRENVANTTQVIDGVTMVAHSLYACVDGGTDLAVAEAITSAKSGGCNYSNGASAIPVSQPVVNPVSGQTITVLFDRPDIIQILVRATVRITDSIQDPETAVKEAILNYAAGNLGSESGLVVGMAVSSFELAGAVNQQAPGIYVQNMEITKSAVPVFSNAEIPIAIFEKASILEGSITVVIV